ncbi:hypothetical protein L211DRAFT_235418 [Terfezia boudieri ATCC MYA-4762]|uniref:AAA+ ATPase domain-containing protein n=1 Tax=Terfezia boudieri ATCC MYA-4762 TaxID=1051890 RepID=A0A3N4LL64_9PEZI|nr:hypothetical protein L211DRAFT_235418 [Terfezia boudieri ATCC MYA-4762]
MLGKLLDVEPTTSTNETVSAIIQGDIGKQSGFYTIALIGRSGAGKTATIVSAARQHFVVYFVCSRKGDPQRSGIIDRSFNILAGEVAEYPDRSPNLTTFDEIRSNNEHLKMRVVDRVKVELLARLLFLCMLFKKNQNLTPEEYFREQINGASEAIHAIVLQLKLYCIDSIDLLLTNVRQELRKKIDDSRGLVVAVDEAQIAEKFILSGRFIAPSKELLPDSQLFNSKGRVHKEYTRGFFTPLCATLSIYTTLVVLGTSLSLSHTDRLESAISKQSYLQVIHNFPSASESQVVGLLKRSLNLEDCDIDASKHQKLSGRLRFSASIITHFNQSDLSDCKQKRLDHTVDKAIMSAKADLRATIEDMLMDGNAKKLLSRIVLAYKLGDSKIGFAYQFDVDYVIGNLCALTRHSDEYN